MFIRNLLGESNYQFLKSFKQKFFPSKKDKEEVASEKDAFIRRKRMFSSLVNANDLCFDVGANIGNRIDPLLEIGAKVVAVEPQKSCYTYLKKKYGDRIILITKGLSDKEGVKKFYVSNASVLSTYSEEWINSGEKQRFKGYNWKKQVMTEMTTLDNLIEKYGVPVFIKIDVEGYELEVLKGLSTPIKTISFEYAVPEHANKALECLLRIEQIDSSIECNYAIGESMELALENWMSVSKMKEHLLSKEFSDTYFGDIYVRKISG